VSKRLLSSSALVAASLLTAGEAGAVERIKLGLGGFFSAFVVAGQEDDGVGEPGFARRGHKVSREAEIYFRGETTLDNGVQVGAIVELEAESCVDQIDESYIYVEGWFGRVQIGQKDPATDAMFYGAPTPITRHGVTTPTFTYHQFGTNAVATPVVIANLSGDAEKVTYFMPRFAGFQLGVSYTPDNCEEAFGAGGAGAFGCGGSYSGFQFENSAGQQAEIFEAAINFVEKFGEVDVALYAAYIRGNLESDVPVGTFKDQEQYGFGAQFGYAGFVLGGSYKHDNRGLAGPDLDRREWGLGLTYAFQAWTLGVQYYDGEVEIGAGLGEDSIEAVELGGSYELGPGIVLTGGVQFWKLDSDSAGIAARNDATIFIVGAHIGF